MEGVLLLTGCIAVLVGFGALVEGMLLRLGRGMTGRKQAASAFHLGQRASLIGRGDLRISADYRSTRWR
jgi:hypothetical protein